MQETWDTSSIPGWGRFSGGGHGNPLQYSCLENPMGRGSWQATVHGVTKSRTWLKWLSIHAGYWAGVLNRDSTGPLADCMMRQMNFVELLDVLTEQECYRSSGGRKSMSFGFHLGLKPPLSFTSYYCQVTHLFPGWTEEYLLPGVFWVLAHSRCSMIIKLYECFSYAHALRILFSPEAIMWGRYAVILMV